MQKYKIRIVNGELIEIDGEPCLQEEYPELQLFLGFYPCDCLNKCPDPTTCLNMFFHQGCYEYVVNDIKTGASFTPNRYRTKENAIESAKMIIERVGVDGVKKKIQEILTSI